MRNQDDGSGRRVKDISEVEMATPPRPEFVIGNKGPDWSVEIGGKSLRKKIVATAHSLFIVENSGKYEICQYNEVSCIMEILI